MRFLEKVISKIEAVDQVGFWSLVFLGICLGCTYTLFTMLLF